MTELLHDIEVQKHLLTFLLGIARIYIFIAFIPFFGPQLNTSVTLPLTLALYIPLHPMLYTQYTPYNLGITEDLIYYLILLIKEIFLGFTLAFIISNIFYIALGVGIIVDNQRGASMAISSDLLTNNEATPLGTILFLAVITLFFTSGAFVNFISLYYSTYVYWSIFDLFPALLSTKFSSFISTQLDFLMLNIVLVSAPFILISLLSDIALGIINRFSPQLNVFILSMPIKSGICALLIIFYFGPFINHQKEIFAYISTFIRTLIAF